MLRTSIGAAAYFCAVDLSSANVEDGAIVMTIGRDF
jgi:hypothetical protein